MKHTIHKWGGDISSIHEVIGPQYTKIPSLSKEINFRLYAISNIGNDVRNECNEVSPILMT